MSSGKVHLAATLTLSALISGCSYIVTSDLSAATALLLGGLYGAIWVTPDLDMRGVRTLPLQAWGPLRIIWQPVLMLSKHRGRSHTSFQGPVFRLLYSGCFLMLLIIILKSIFPGLHPYASYTAEFLKHHWQLMFLSFMIMQWTHLIMDKIYPSLKRI